ncbi:hypothetical protein KEJ32_07845 [Candidatus Bathyarchaeota archaeon]|nr:hypothetical protein [Candidatus Bathyarchaeota archaeon]
MDTVPGYIPVRIISNEIYGRGAVDAKAPLTSMILSAHLVEEVVKEGKILWLVLLTRKKRA